MTACRPGSRIQRKTEQEAHVRRSIGRLSLYNSISFCDSMILLSLKFEATPLNLLNVNISVLRFLFKQSPLQTDVIGLFSNLLMSSGPCGEMGQRQPQTTCHLQRFGGKLLRNPWLLGTSVPDLSNTSVPLLETNWQMLATNRCSFLGSRSSALKGSRFEKLGLKRSPPKLSELPGLSFSGYTGIVPRLPKNNKLWYTDNRPLKATMLPG